MDRIQKIIVGLMTFLSFIFVALILFRQSMEQTAYEVGLFTTFTILAILAVAQIILASRPRY